ncbi:class I SAM-dependent methyltransferase [Xanthocytophaga agilis]|uniref:Class I SAM-dependent methyltransferase n=1 Tax=Xanthocytophaga agilis TaxID=3048010 RepID=A0AAE3R4P6_9BACT|nr:class I SAM-dependent methyltransferase [Xanthocytophaga agilis]MDJ1500617.1 class I SAM-dependent methyltransferase [Xanthocytophaga agilis]
MEHILEKHRRIWDEKKILQIIYSEWYTKIIKDLAQTQKPTVELGAGGGNFKQFKPDVIAADVVPFDWLDMVFDAHHMPFKDNELGNIVMIDVLHHLDNPVAFLKEAQRVLEPGGRLIMLEPYPSLFSLPIYRKFHPEPFIMDVDYFQKKETNEKDPWDSNQAIPYLLFFKHRDTFKKIFGDQFHLAYKEHLSFLLYPASGGFENKSMIPDWSIPMFQFFEKALTPLRSILAFRCYVILEKK